MEQRQQKDVPPDFSELDHLHKFASSFLGRVEKVGREVNLDNNIGAIPNEDTKTKMAELRDMVIDVENRIQDASDDLSQPENLHKHVDVFHNYYTWVNREITRISKHLQEHGYHCLDEHKNLPMDMHQIWDVGLNGQTEVKNQDCSMSIGNSRQVSEHGTYQPNDGHTAIEGEDAAIDSVDVSFDLHSRREKGENIQETPKSSSETVVTSKFVTVHELSPQQDWEQSLANFKAYFGDKPNESLTFGDNTSFMSTNSELIKTPLTKPDCQASRHSQVNGWFSTGEEPISGLGQVEPSPSMSDPINEFNETPLCSPKYVAGGGSPSGYPIALCTEDEYETLRDQISLNLQDVNSMIMKLNLVHLRTPDEPLSLSLDDRKILNQLNRIKYGIKGMKGGYFPITMAL